MLEHKKAIRDAASQSDVETLEKLWIEAEDVCALAEARMRILLAKLEPPVLGEPPLWLQESIPAAANKNVGLLIRALVNKVPDLPEPYIYHGLSVGVVIVSWSKITWVVNPSNIRWPGVNVRTFARGLKPVQAWYQAFGAVDAASKLF